MRRLGTQSGPATGSLSTHSTGARRGPLRELLSASHVPHRALKNPVLRLAAWFALASVLFITSLAVAQTPNKANGNTLYNVNPDCAQAGCHNGIPRASNTSGIANAANSPSTVLAAASCPGGITYGGVNSCTLMTEAAVQNTVGPSAANGTQNRADVAYYIADYVAPVVQSGTAPGTAFNTATTIDLTPFISGYNSLGNFTFAGGNASSVTITGSPSHGTLGTPSGLSVTYTPFANASNINDTFTFSATSPDGETSGSATITIHIGTAPTPNAPNVTVGPFTYEGTGITINLASQINAANPGPPAGIATGLGSPTAGTATLNGGRVTAVTAPFTLTYSAPADKLSDSFHYTVTGPGGTSAIGLVTVQITPPGPPVAVGASLTAGFNSGSPAASSVLTITSAFTGPVDSYGTPLEISGPNNGTVTAGPGPGQVTYTPKAVYTGPDSFSITATNASGTSAAATIAVTVQAPSPPTRLIATVNTNATYNNGPPAAQTTIDLSSGVFGGYVQGLKVNGAALPVATTHGSVAQGSSAEILLYTPALGFHGTDTFSVTAYNQSGTSTATTVNAATALPAAPVAHNLAVATPVQYNTATPIDLSASISGVLATTNPVAITQPSHGVATVSGKIVTYTPAPSFYGGSDSFTYTATGPGGTSAPATVSLSDALPPPPSVQPKSIRVTYNTATPVNVASLVSGVSTSIAVSAPPTHGTATVNGLVITYTPATGYLGPDSFSYASSGPGGTSPSAAISITVSALPTVAPPVTLDVSLNSPTTIDLARFITGSGITGVQITQPPAHGSVTVNGTQITYSPVANYFGDDTFTYRAFGAGGASTGTVTIHIVGRPNPAQNSDVSGLIDAQISEARVFTRAQISNFQQRMQSLHEHAPAADTSASTGSSVVAAATARAGGLQPDQANGIGPIPLTGSTAALGAGTTAAPAPTGAASSVLPSMAAAGRGQHAGAPAIDPFAASLASPLASPSAGPTADTDSGQFRLAGPLSATLPYRSGVGGEPGVAPAPEPLTVSLNSLDLASVAGALSATTGSASTGGVWVAGSIDFGNREQSAGLPNGLKFHSNGVSLGGDHRFSDSLVAGLGLGYASDRTFVGTDGTQSKASGTVVAAYASFQPTANTYVDSVVGAGSLDFDSARPITAIGAVASGHRTGEQVFASVTAGYEFHANDLHWSPYGRLDLATDRLHQYAESAAGLNALTYSAENVPTTDLAVGVRMDALHQTSFGSVTPHARLEYQHDFEGQSQASVAYSDLIGGPTYGIVTSTVNHNALVGGVGVDFNFQRGLMFGVDYQALRSSGNESSQMLRFRLSQELDDGLLPSAGLLLPSAFTTPVGVRIDASYTDDDNVSRSFGADKLSDQSYSLHVTRPFLVPLLDNVQAIVTPFVGGEKFVTYGGLNHAVYGVNGELQYRASGDFASPILAVFLHSNGEEYSSNERTGYRYSVGFSATQPVTDRISLFGALAYDNRHGNSAVFDDEDGAARLNLDYALGPHATVYLSGEYRRGDVVSTGEPSLDNLNIASVVVRDDVFSDGVIRNAYRIRANTYLLGLGYNLALGETDSLDFSWRWAQSTPLHQPNFTNADFIRYFDNQFTVVYLVRF